MAQQETAPARHIRREIQIGPEVGETLTFDSSAPLIFGSFTADERYKRRGLPEVFLPPGRLIHVDRGPHNILVIQAQLFFTEQTGWRIINYSSQGTGLKLPNNPELPIFDIKNRETKSFPIEDGSVLFFPAAKKNASDVFRLRVALSPDKKNISLTREDNSIHDAVNTTPTGFTKNPGESVVTFEDQAIKYRRMLNSFDWNFFGIQPVPSSHPDLGSGDLVTVTSDQGSVQLFYSTDTNSNRHLSCVILHVPFPHVHWVLQYPANGEVAYCAKVGNSTQAIPTPIDPATKQDQAQVLGNAWAILLRQLGR